MAERGRPKVPLVFTDEERETLVRWSRRAKSSQALALRCRIVLACAQGTTNKAVAAELGVWPQTVTKWRARFITGRLAGLVDEPRPGAPRTITDEQVEAVVVATLEETPKDATHWSRASMAKRSGLSKSTVGRIWKAFRLKPHLAETFKLSSDPQFIDKVRDVVGLYLDPPGHAPAAHPRLRPQRDHQPVRGLGRGQRQGDRLDPPQAPLGGVPQVPGQARQAGARRVGCPSDLRQLRHPQNRHHPAVAGRPSPLPAALRPGQLVVAQPGRAVVQRADHQVVATRRPQERAGPGG